MVHCMHFKLNKDSKSETKLNDFFYELPFLENGSTANRFLANISVSNNLNKNHLNILIFDVF